jgi:hypothetical protein
MSADEEGNAGGREARIVEIADFGVVLHGPRPDQPTLS